MSDSAPAREVSQGHATTPDPPRYVIVGAGSLGVVYTAALAAAGCDVCLVASERSAERLVSAGRLMVTGALEFDAPVRRGPQDDPWGGAGCITVSTRAPRRADGAIFATKGHDLQRAAEEVAADGTVDWVLGIQNGLRKNAVLGEVFSSDAVMGGISTIGAERDSEGLVHVTLTGPTIVGETTSQQGSERCARLVDRMRRGGLRAEVTANVAGAEWIKTLQAVPAFVRVVIAAAMDMIPHHSASRTPMASMSAELATLAELASIAEAEGVTVVDIPPLRAMSDLQRDWSEVARARLDAREAWNFDGWPGRGSIVQDLLAGRQLEAEWILEDLARRADATRVAAPWIGLALAMSRTVESGRP